jgi:hypothetical protein
MFGFPVQAGDEVACGGVRFRVLKVLPGFVRLLRWSPDGARRSKPEWYPRRRIRKLAFNPLGPVRPGWRRG